jgi:hypothetical protein
MATMVFVEWLGITREQYDRLMSTLSFATSPPNGAISHCAGFTPNGIKVVDVWDSREQFEQFQRTRLTPAVQQMGVATQPKVEFVEVYRAEPPIDVLKNAATQATGSRSR